MIVGARFLGSATSAANASEFALSEVAFLGRSNVGKSSLINALTNQKQLAKSSATPGKTRLINFFEINFKDEERGKFDLVFIDLPGFGYARISRTQRQEWDKNLNEFLRARKSLKLLVHLRDARHENLEFDEQINAYLQGILSPSQKLLAVFTKADKLNQAQKARLLKAYPNAIIVSSAKKTGLERLENALIAHALGLENTLEFKTAHAKTTPTKHKLGFENSPKPHTLGL